METWKAIPGYEGKYEVSDQGRVRSLRYVNATVDKPRETPLILKGARHSHGYPMVGLYKDAKQRQDVVHRLVLEAFVGPCPEGHECAHLDGDPSNPALENLAWVTRQENMDHMLQHGTRRFGSKHHGSKLTEETAALAKELLKTHSQQKVADMLEVSRGAISAIAQGRTWKHV